MHDRTQLMRSGRPHSHQGTHLCLFTAKMEFELRRVARYRLVLIWPIELIPHHIGGMPRPIRIKKVCSCDHAQVCPACRERTSGKSTEAASHAAKFEGVTNGAIFERQRPTDTVEKGQ